MKSLNILKGWKAVLFEVPGTVFFTSMAQYAIGGYEVRALDYVLKPINYYALSMKLRRIFHTILSRGQKAILVNTRDEKLRIDVQEIQYIEIDSHTEEAVKEREVVPSLAAFFL